MRLHVLDLGREKMDRSLVVANWRLASLSDPTPRGEFAEFPIPAYFIDHPSGGILFDTGCHPQCMGSAGRWPQAFQERYPFFGEAEHSIQNRLKEIGVEPKDVRTVVLSHLHNDHGGGLEFFPKAQVIVHEDELHACLASYASGDRMSGYIWDDIDHWIRLGLDFELVHRDGEDFEFADGVTILNFGAGHARGMLGLLLDLPETGHVLIASDTIYCAENFGPPTKPAGVIYDRIGYLRTIERIRRLQRKTGAQIWFGHDPAQFETLRKGPEYYA